MRKAAIGVVLFLLSIWYLKLEHAEDSARYIDLIRETLNKKLWLGLIGCVAALDLTVLLKEAVPWFKTTDPRIS